MRRWLAGLALVTIGWAVTPGALPVYDGVGTDDPYRYVGKKPAPTSATDTAQVQDQTSLDLQIKTAEKGPQLIVDLAAGAFRATTPEVTLSGEPVAPDGALPRGEFDSNVYRVTATAGATLLAEQAQGFLFLRSAVMTEKPAPVIVHRATPTAAWVEVKTTVTGRDILATPFRETGDYAVVRLPGSKTLDQAGGLTGTRAVFLGGGVVLLVVVTVLVLRRPRDDEP
jgi:hypothetical protein